MTGQLEEEKMQVYVRLGIRLLYKVREQRQLPRQMHAHVRRVRVGKVAWKALGVCPHLLVMAYMC